jgi:hypothetical protein
VGLFNRFHNPLSTQGRPELSVHPGSPVGRYPLKVVVTLGVDPEAVVGDPVLLVTTLVQRLKVAQDVCIGDLVAPPLTESGGDTTPVEQLIDRSAMQRTCRVLHPSRSAACLLVIQFCSGASSSGPLADNKVSSRFLMARSMAGSAGWR